jgi:hypothetical protein
MSLRVGLGGAVVLVCCVASALAGGRAAGGGGIFDFGNDPARRTATTKAADGATKPTVAAAAATKPSVPVVPGELMPVVATGIHIVADDFVADIHHNGKLVPAENRKLRAEIFGAQVEYVSLNLRPGDWVVFNVVNNRLRWNGAYYFAAAAVDIDGLAVLSSQARTGDWSACDDLAQAAKFVADRDHLRDQKPQPIAKPWDRGDKEIARAVPDFDGDGIWGGPTARSTWIKLVVPAAR